MRHLTLLLFSWTICYAVGYAQIKIKGNWPNADTSRVHVLILDKGDVFMGKLLQYDSNEVVFKLFSGDTLIYPPTDVKMVKINPSPTKVISERLLVSPTGFGLEKGENEYRNIMFLYNSYHRGITKNITLGGGIMPFFITYLGWVDAKLSFELGENLHFGTGGILGGGYAYNFSEDEGQEAWLKYGLAGGFGVLTIGSRDKFINLSTAKVFVFEEEESNSSPWMYSLGGSYRVWKSNRIFVEAGNLSGVDLEWSIAMGLSTLYKGNNFDISLLFFPGEKPRMLPAFGFARRF